MNFEFLIVVVVDLIPRLCCWNRFLEDPLPYDYTFYCQHIIVADENYFTTLFKNSPYCQDHASK
jgi:hypothetical protein